MNYKSVIIDTHYFLYRAYYASYKAQLSDRKGRPTGAIKFINNMVLPLLRQYPQASIIAVFDCPGKNFRHELYPQYKANRDEMPQELQEQRKVIKKLFKHLGILVVSKRGVEADDVLGTFAYHAKEQEHRTLILTGDKDIKQFLNEFVDLYDPRSQTKTTVESLLEDTGLHPNQYAALLAIKGDTVDNIPGVKGIGDAGATKLLKEYGTLKEIVKNGKNIKGAIGKKIVAARTQLALSFKLTRGRTAIDLPQRLCDIKRGHHDVAAAEKLLLRYDIGRKKSRGLF